MGEDVRVSPVVEVSDLRVLFGTVIAVERIDLIVPPGEVG